MGKKIEFTKIEIEKIKKLYLDDVMSIHEIGKVFGFSDAPIIRILKQEGSFMNLKDRRKYFYKIYEIGKLYMQQGMSPINISFLINKSTQTVVKILKEQNIYMTRHKRMRYLLKTGKSSVGGRILFTDKQEKEILSMYTVKVMNCFEIGEEVGCSHGVIERILKERGVLYDKHQRIIDRYNVGKVKTRGKINQAMEKEIIANYEKGFKIGEIMQSFDISKPTFYYLLRRNGVNLKYLNTKGKTLEEIHGIEKAKQIRGIQSIASSGKILSEETRKKISDAVSGTNHPLHGTKWSEIRREKTIKSMTGKRRPKTAKIQKEKFMEGKLSKCIGAKLENHHNWSGGLSFQPYSKDFNQEFKNFIKSRDSYRCMKCFISEKEHLERFNFSLAVHHINYDKLLSIPENCCTLCMKCNSEVNLNRPHWTKFFQSLLSEKYGYNYSEYGEVIMEVVNEN